MPHQFQIEFISKFHQSYYLMPRQIIPGEPFSVIETPYLNGCKLKPELSVPRDLDKDGQPRTDLFVFFLADGNDIAKFTNGMIVELAANQI